MTKKEIAEFKEKILFPGSCRFTVNAILSRLIPRKIADKAVPFKLEDEKKNASPFKLDLLDKYLKKIPYRKLREAIIRETGPT